MGFQTTKKFEDKDLSGKGQECDGIIFLSFCEDDGVGFRARAEWVEQGIGDYEFWGQACTHSEMGWELEDWVIDIDREFTINEEQEIVDKILQYMNENVEVAHAEWD